MNVGSYGADGRRLGGHPSGCANGKRLLRTCREADLRNRGRRGVDRSRKSLRQIQFRQPGHGKDLRQLDGGVRLSDRLRHGLKIIFRRNVLVYDNIRNS